MLQPFQKGVALLEQARPIAEMLKELSAVLTAANTASKDGIATPDTEEEEPESD